MRQPERITRKPRLHAGRLRRHRPLLALAGWLLCWTAQADQGGLELREADGAWRPALALETDIRLRVVGLLARVEITQRYQNEASVWLEARYLLPLPAEAAVDTLEVRIGERRIEGRIEARTQASQTYRRAAAEGRRAALVAQHRPNLFQTALANIGPGEAVEVQVGFWQQVDYRDGTFSIDLPQTLTPRYRSPDSAAGDAAPATAIAAAGIAAGFSLAAELVPGLPLEEVTSPSHPIVVQREGEVFRVQLARAVEPGDRDFVLRWRPQPSSRPQGAMFTEEIEGETYALLLLVPPAQPPAPVPRELILVVDTSGSMEGASLQQAAAALEATLARLRPQDRFNLIRFSDAPESLFPGPVAALPGPLLQARQWLGLLRAEGGTEIGPALDAALAGPVAPGYLRQVVLLTDAAIDQEQALLDRIESGLGAARLFPVGIGSAPNAHFIRRAAEVGRGSFAMIRSLDEVESGVRGLLERIDRPLLQDLEVIWPVAAEAYPERLPDLYAGEPLQLLARLDRGTGVVQLRGTTAGGAWQERIALEPGGHRRLTGVGRAWAAARLRALQDALRHGADPDRVRRESLELALRHRLVSRYTSLVAVETHAARPADAAMVPTAVMHEPPAGSLGMARTATPARSLFGAALALLLIGAALLAPPSPGPRPTAQPPRQGA